MKRHRPKLTLSSNTIRTLTPVEIERAGGGCETGSITTESTRTRQAPGG